VGYKETYLAEGGRAGGRRSAPVTSIRAVKGTRDILPDETPAWQRSGRHRPRALRRYGYRELRTPDLRGDPALRPRHRAETDVVSKEMYTFDDRDGPRYLRPRAPRASCARSSRTT
jgi:histidyl-tRNA synthetase